MRIAIVTAYFKEDRATLERCIESVRSQAVPVEHVLVADGHPQDWVRGAGVRHVILDRPHGDFGDTPRLVGLMLAIREAFDAVQFLDADNVVLPRHAAMAAARLAESGAHLLVLKRRFLRPDGSAIPLEMSDADALAAIDTNCYFFGRPAFPTALKWALIPRELSFVGDRVFHSVLSKAGHPVAVAPEATVGYNCLWEEIYRAAGEVPPAGCKTLTGEREKAAAWWTALDDGRRDGIQQMLGIRISFG